MYSIVSGSNYEPVNIVEPVTRLSRRLYMSGYFEKKIKDQEGKYFIIKIDINKKCGTVAKCTDEKFETIQGNEMDINKLNGADRLFEEANYMYKSMTMIVR